MKTVTLLLATVLFVTAARAEPPAVVEDIITRGPYAGERRIITNTVAFPKEASVVQSETVVALAVNGQRTDVPVELTAYRHRFLRSQGTNDWPLTCYEFQVRARGGDGFVWSSWAPDFRQPHRFQVLTTESGKSYACYIRQGVHLFHLSESREPDAMRRGFWENPRFEGQRPDALPLVQIGQIQECLGWTNTVALGPQTWDVTVDKLSDSGGELRVTVHGTAPQPQCIFALRKDKWELVSTRGSGVTADARPASPPGDDRSQHTQSQWSADTVWTDEVPVTDELAAKLDRVMLRWRVEREFRDNRKGPTNLAEAHGFLWNWVNMAVAGAPLKSVEYRGVFFFSGGTRASRVNDFSSGMAIPKGQAVIYEWGK